MGRATGDTRPRRPPSDDERQLVEPAATECLDDLQPTRIEVGRRRGRAPAGNAIRLLDERNAEPDGERHVLRSDEILGGDSSTRAVAEDEDAARRIGVVEMRLRRAVSRVQHESGHATILAEGRRREPAETHGLPTGDA